MLQFIRRDLEGVVNPLIQLSGCIAPLSRLYFIQKKGGNVMAITKKIRFEVFKRDGFKCAYCGKTPPSVVLEIDHIDPKSKGGKDDINNLITACFDCNRGKAATPLQRITPKLSENLEVLKEQEDQLKEYRKFVRKIELRTKDDIDEVNELYNKFYPGWVFSDKFIHTSLKMFLKKLPKHQVIEALEIAVSHYPTNKDRVINYFCGVCWHKIKGTRPEGWVDK